MADFHSRYSQAGSVMKLRVLLNRALGGGLAIFLCVSLKAEDEKVCVELLTDLSEIQIIIEVKRSLVYGLCRAQCLLIEGTKGAE